MLRRSRGVGFWALLLVSGLCLVPAGVALADDGDEGGSTHAAPYMRMGVGARALAMGGAYVAAGNDATVGYWNPAELGWACGTQLAGMFALGMEEDREMSYLAASHHFGWGALGLSLLTAGMDDIEQRDGQGQPLGEFNYNDLGVMVHGAYTTGPLSLGATLKYLRESLGAEVDGDDAASGVGFDLGAAAQPLDWMRFGVVVRDIATELGDNENGANNLPLDLRGGVAIMPLQGFTFAFDLQHVEDEEDLKFHTGAEYAMPLGQDFGGALRLGLNDGELTAGLGLMVKFVEFNYAFVEEPENFLGESHRVGVTLKFGEDCGPIDYGPRMGDADLDGIADNIDDCPHAAEDFDGFQDEDGCPDPDNDGDGIPDVDDECPGRAEDFDGFEDADGCPDIDNDGDGILDADDQCPNAAETFNRYEDTDGCPDDAQPEFPMMNINFKYDSTEWVGTDPTPTLDHMADVLKRNPELRVRIVGHTDSRGSDAYNQHLSDRRAAAIRDYFVSKGVNAGQLETAGMGEKQPLVPNDSERNMLRNRRIEFDVLD